MSEYSPPDWKALIQMLDARRETSRRRQREFEKKFWSAELKKRRALKRLAELRNQRTGS